MKQQEQPEVVEDEAQVDEANPRAENSQGHIIMWDEDGHDHTGRGPSHHREPTEGAASDAATSAASAEYDGTTLTFTSFPIEAYQSKITNGRATPDYMQPILTTTKRRRVDTTL